MNSPIQQNKESRSIPKQIARVHSGENLIIPRTLDPLNDSNWIVWRKRMMLILRLYGVEGYARGQVKYPDLTEDPIGADNWTFNDTYAQNIIADNITSTEMLYIIPCANAHEMWTNLEAVYEPKSSQTFITYMRKLRDTKAADGDDIGDHLNKLMQYWVRIDSMGYIDNNLSGLLFNIMISNSLPPSWEDFIQSRVLVHESFAEVDPKKRMSPQQLIGILKEEYHRRKMEKVM